MVMYHHRWLNTFTLSVILGTLFGTSLLTQVQATPTPGRTNTIEDQGYDLTAADAAVAARYPNLGNLAYNAQRPSDQTFFERLASRFQGDKSVDSDGIIQEAYNIGNKYPNCFIGQLTRKILKDKGLQGSDSVLRQIAEEFERGRRDYWKRDWYNIHALYLTPNYRNCSSSYDGTLEFDRKGDPRLEWGKENGERCIKWKTRVLEWEAEGYFWTLRVPSSFAEVVAWRDADEAAKQLL